MNNETKKIFLLIVLLLTTLGSTLAGRKDIALVFGSMATSVTAWILLGNE